MSAPLLALLQRLYTAAVWLYPGPFRARFGAEMQAVFAEALAAAAQVSPSRVFALCAREAAGLLPNLLTQYARAWHAEHARLRAQAVRPSWAQALAASVPGLLLVGGSWVFRLPGEAPAWLGWVGWGAAAALTLLGVWAARRGWRYTTWAFPALGLVAWLGLIQVLSASQLSALLIQHGLLLAVPVLALALTVRRGWHWPRATWVCLGLMGLLALVRATRQVLTQTYFGADDPSAYRLYLYLAGLMPAAIVVGLLLLGRLAVRWHGLGAVLLLLGPCAVLIDLLIDPTYGLRSSPVPSQALLAPLLRSLLYGGLLIVAPLWLLRARSAASQAQGVIVGLLLALVAVVAIPYLYWRQPLIDILPLAELALGLTAALAAYATPHPSQSSAFPFTRPTDQDPVSA